jgi:hypothetical protein
VVLGNPIQFQCSLHSLMGDPELALQADVRNSVWRNLFKAKMGSLKPLENDFKARVRQCTPTLLLLAPTYAVRRQLSRSARGLAPHVVEIHRHPCLWNSATSVE